MRLVQIQLRPSVPFWFIGTVLRLNQENKTSDFFDVDTLEDGIKKIINQSINRQEIFAFDYNGTKIHSLDDAKYISGNHAVSIDDVDDEEDGLIPEIVSVTVGGEEEEEEEDILLAEPGEDHIENAKILLEQNGNTVKRMIKNMTITDDNILMLKACLRQETSNRNRRSIVSAIEKILMEC